MAKLLVVDNVLHTGSSVGDAVRRPSGHGRPDGLEAWRKQNLAIRLDRLRLLLRTMDGMSS